MKINLANRRTTTKVKICSFEFQMVDHFKYLGKMSNTNREYSRDKKLNLTSPEQGKLRTFERKIIIRIYGLKKVEDDEYRRLMK